jgi:hypothetical protein
MVEPFSSLVDSSSKPQPREKTKSRSIRSACGKDVILAAPLAFRTSCLILRSRTSRPSPRTGKPRRSNPKGRLEALATETANTCTTMRQSGWWLAREAAGLRQRFVFARHLGPVENMLCRENACAER